MNLLTSRYVRPMAEAANQFLQVLVTQFALRRQGGGVCLRVRLDEQTPAIWLSAGREEVHRQIPDFQRRARMYQADLDAVLLHGRGDSYSLNDPHFPFRYVSGGVLPVLRMGGRDYYALFYRDIFPIGWNIASGFGDSRHELLSPLDIIERELREELLIVNPADRKRYVFEGETGRWLGLPDCALARRLWQARFRRLRFPELEDLDLPMKWLHGPDSVEVTVDGPRGTRASGGAGGCFLNINAEDFGIEVDRIVQINIDERAVLCDGEIIQGQLLDRVVGLFDVERLNGALIRGVREFLPDICFRGAVRYEGAACFRRALTRYMESPLVASGRKAWRAQPLRLDLCPATRHIIQRYQAPAVWSPVEEGKYQVFISFGSEDVRLAKIVYDAVAAETGKQVFFSQETTAHGNFYPEINGALESAKCLIAVASRPHHLMRQWPEYEYGTFHAAILCGRKPRTARLVSFIKGFRPVELPPPLWRYQAVQVKGRHMDPAIGELLKIIR